MAGPLRPRTEVVQGRKRILITSKTRGPSGPDEKYTEMKKFVTSSLLVTGIILVITGCSDKRKPGRTYVPDMAYSRAYETYAERDSNVFTTDPAMRGGRIFYDNNPVKGTIKRGEAFPFEIGRAHV